MTLLRYRHSQKSLVRNCDHYLETMMTEETTTEQLAEIEGQAEDTPATEYTPPEGWRVLAVGERLRDGDVTVRRDGYQYPTERVGGWVGSNQRYIRPIESQPQPEPVQVREGRWKTRGGDIRNVTSRPAGDGRKDLFPWWDAAYGGTWTSGGRYYFGEESPSDLVEYLGPIEPQTEPQPEPVQVPDSNEQIRLLKDCNARQAELIADLKYERSGAMERAEVSARSSRKLTEQIENLRSEVSYVQNLLGTERRRVTQLEDLVGSLRTINEAQEKAFEAAGKENTALRNQLLAVKTELASVAADRQRLQIELDAAHQVPADSPELRQLRADLAEVTQDRDTYRHAHELLLNDVNATHARTKAMTVEAIAEWLEPIRLVDHPNLSNETLQHLPQIMRSLTGLADDEDVD